MRFVFTIKTKAGNVLTIHVEAPDRVEADAKVKRENPSCTVVKCEPATGAREN